MKRIALIGAMLALPALTFAAQINDIQGVGSTITDLINNVAVPVLFAIAFIVFIYGVFQFFILGAKDEEKQATGRSLMLWGLIGFGVGSREHPRRNVQRQQQPPIVPNDAKAVRTKALSTANARRNLRAFAIITL
jgi:predicted small secreted protein